MLIIARRANRRLLDAGIRFVNDFLIPNYGPAPKKPIVSGHPEIEMVLIELYRITGDKRQLNLAGYILHGDARIEMPKRRTIYMFSGTPFTARTKMQGHAVRAMYACCGATDYYMETGDPTYLQTLNRLWNDMTTIKMYVTGGVGSRADGEAFGDAYELPNFRAKHRLAFHQLCRRLQRVNTTLMLNLARHAWNSVAGKQDHARAINFLHDWERLPQFVEQVLTLLRNAYAPLHPCSAIKADAELFLFGIGSLEIFLCPFLIFADQFDVSIARFRDFFQTLFKR